MEINTNTHEVNVTKLTVGSLVVDFEVVVKPGVNASAHLLDERKLQWALDETAAEDTGRHNDTTADTTATATPFSSTLALYTAQPDVNDTIFMVAGLAAPTATAVSSGWSSHVDGSPVPPASAPDADAGAGGCGAGCIAGVAIAVVAGVLVGAGVAVMAMRRSAKSGRGESTVAHRDFATNDLSTPMEDAEARAQNV